MALPPPSPAQQSDLFGAAQLPLPPGLVYEPDFLTREDEAALLAHIETLPLAPMRYQQYAALRQVVSYGGTYDFSAQRLEPAPPLPDWLQPLREKVARWDWQHSIAPTRSLRCSLTLRTARAAASAR